MKSPAQIKEYLEETNLWDKLDELIAYCWHNDLKDTQLTLGELIIEFLGEDQYTLRHCSNRAKILFNINGITFSINYYFDSWGDIDETDCIKDLEEVDQELDNDD